jgi:acyl-CoA thioesterase-1
MPKLVPPSILFLLLVFSCKQPEKQTPITTPPTNTTAVPTTNKNTILFFGNSLTAGYGLNSMDEAFPSLIAHRIDSLHLPYAVVNAGLSGETTAGGKSRIGWVLRQPVSIFVLELGANDGLRGIPLTGNNATLIPFLLQNVGGIPQLNQGDGIHPTAKGHRIVAENVWQVLAPLLQK